MEKPRLGEWLQLISFVCGALGLFSVGVTHLQSLKDHERRLTQIERTAADLAVERNETNVRLARIEERLNTFINRGN